MRPARSRHLELDRNGDVYLVEPIGLFDLHKLLGSIEDPAVWLRVPDELTLEFDDILRRHGR